MKRVRWLCAKWPGSIQELGDMLKANAYELDRYDGFIVDRIRDEFVEGRYVERYSFQETVINPYGEEEKYNRINYKILDFSFNTSYPSISIYDSPRSINSFISKLLAICDFSLYIKHFKVDLLKWLNNIQELFQQNIIVDVLQVSDLEVDKGVQAKIMITGNKDVRESLTRIISTENYYIIDKMRLKIIVDRYVVPVFLSSNGSVKIKKENFITLYPLLRGTLPQPCK